MTKRQIACRLTEVWKRKFPDIYRNATKLLHSVPILRFVYFLMLLYFSSKRPLGRPRRRWVDNIRTDLQEVGCGYMDWIGLAQDRDRWRTIVSAVMNLRVPWNAGSFLTSCKPVSFSRRILHLGVSKVPVQPTFPLVFSILTTQKQGLQITHFLRIMIFW